MQVGPTEALTGRVSANYWSIDVRAQDGPQVQRMASGGNVNKYAHAKPKQASLMNLSSNYLKRRTGFRKWRGLNWWGLENKKK